MKKINFENFKEPGLSKEILMQLQDNIEDAIENQVKKENLFKNVAGQTSGIVFSKSVDNYDLVFITLGNKNSLEQRVVLAIPVCFGIYSNHFVIRADSNYEVSRNSRIE